MVKTTHDPDIIQITLTYSLWLNIT